MIAPPDSVSGWPHPFNPDNNDLYNLLRTVVDYFAEKEVYVAIDWHYIAILTTTLRQRASSGLIWRRDFKDDTHVIFELFNEPINQVGSDAADWDSVKSDMETWIGIVRASAPTISFLSARHDGVRLLGRRPQILLVMATSFMFPISILLIGFPTSCTTRVLLLPPPQYILS